MISLSKSEPKDETADASQFLSRIGYVVLALAAPAGVVLHPLAIFVLFPVGIVLICLASLIDPPATLAGRFTAGLTSPAVLLGLAGLAWAAISILWTPFSISAGQHVLKLSLWTLAVWLATSVPREHARATDMYLFPLGLVLGMVSILAVWIARRQGAPLDEAGIVDGGVALATLLFPVMGGLAARGRNGYARLLLILAFVYVFAIDSTPTMIALFVGFTALSFAVSDLERTTVDLSWVAGGLILFAPVLVLLAEPLARLMMHAKLPGLPPPFPTIAFASSVVKNDWPRLLTGHGFETVARGLRGGILPAQTPRGLVFEIWYEFGFVGAAIASAAAWFGFRAIGAAPQRLAPYLAAAFACILTLAVLSESLIDMTWLTTLGIAIIVADIAGRSQYRTTRPSVAYLAHF
jgi:hypothetical protein